MLEALQTPTSLTLNCHNPWAIEEVVLDYGQLLLPIATARVDIVEGDVDSVFAGEVVVNTETLGTVLFKQDSCSYPEATGGLDDARLCHLFDLFCCCQLGEGLVDSGSGGRWFVLFFFVFEIFIYLSIFNATWSSQCWRSSSVTWNTKAWSISMDIFYKYALFVNLSIPHGDWI